MNRVSLVERWLMILDLPPLVEQEVLFLSDPEEKPECEVFKDLVFICEKRYKKGTFWPDFSVLGLDCEMPEKPNKYTPRTFCIGL